MSWQPIDGFECRSVDDPDEYHAHGRTAPGDPNFWMSRSELMKFDACPEEWILGIPREESKALKFGTLFDAYLTMPDAMFQKKFDVLPLKYETTVLVCPSCESVGTGKKCSKCKVEREERTEEKDWNGNATECRERLKANEEAGRISVKQKEYDDCLTAISRFRTSHDGWLEDFYMSSKEQFFAAANWVDEDRGVTFPFKILIDLFPDQSHYEGIIGDVKTCNDPRKRAWKLHVFKYDYHVQAALYLDVLSCALRVQFTDFVHLITKNKAPFICTARFLHPDFIELGRNRYIEALDHYCACVAARQWPGLDTDEVEPEPWMLNGESEFAGIVETDEDEVGVF